MPSLPCTATVIGVIAVGIRLRAEALATHVPKAIAKTVASLAFVAVAATRGALDATWTTTLLIGLGLALVGDLLLLSNAHRAFRAGLFAFLAGHVACVIAFALRGVAPIGALVTPRSCWPRCSWSAAGSCRTSRARCTARCSPT